MGTKTVFTLAEVNRIKKRFLVLGGLSGLVLGAFSLFGILKSHDYDFEVPTNNDYTRWIDKGDPDKENTANGMLKSYESKVMGDFLNRQKRFFLFKAPYIRDLINANPGIEDIQISFGLAYGRDGKKHRTFLITGIDAQGNHLYYNNQVLEHCLPCPENCSKVISPYKYE